MKEKTNKEDLSKNKDQEIKEKENNEIIKVKDQLANETGTNEQTTPLIQILNGLNKRLTDKNNSKKSIDYVCQNMKKEEEKKEKMRYDNTKYNYFLFFYVGLIFVITNLVGIFTLRSIMDSLFEIFKNSIQYFIWKKSDLEKYELTDIESRFNSPYNFYEQYFNDISQNDVDFDLIMFWDFFGSFLYDSFDFTCTSIFFLIVNSLSLAFIGGFDFLDIDVRNHKYNFLQVLYIIFIYIFLWIGVGSSALLSQQIFIDSFEIFKKRKKETGNINSLKNNSNSGNNDAQNLSEIKPIKTNQDALIIEEKKNEENKNKPNGRKNEAEYFSMMFLTSFIAFLIHYYINREIIKYRQKYISKGLKRVNKDKAFSDINSKDKKLFLLAVCLPFFLEIVTSLIVYSIFYHMTFFKDDNNNRQNKIKKKANKKPFTKGENMLKADEFYYKKICGYVFFKEILIEREKRTRCEEACYFFRCLANYFCRCFECITIIIVSFRDCLKNSFCYICKKKCNCYCYHCECCRGSECCCCDTNSFGNNEIDFCLCYQEEKCSIWFYDYINNKEQQRLILFIFIIAFFQFFTIGLEEIYDEKNKNNINQENIGFQLFLACIIYVGVA